MTAQLPGSGRSTPEKTFVDRGPCFDPMFSQDLGKMGGRTVQQLSQQSDLEIEVPFYEQGAQGIECTASFFERRDVECISPSSLVDILSTGIPYPRQDNNTACADAAEQANDLSLLADSPYSLNLLEGIVEQHPLENLEEEDETLSETSEKSCLDELESEEDVAQSVSSESSYTINKRKHGTRRKRQRSSKQRIGLEKSVRATKKVKIKWTEDLVKEFVKIVEKFTDTTKPQEPQVNWQSVAAETSVIAKKAINHSACRNAYKRRFNPNLKPLTIDIKTRIEACLKNEAFTRPDGSIFYTGLADHFEVGDDKVRTWILSSSELNDNPFFQQIRQQAANHIGSCKLKKYKAEAVAPKQTTVPQEAVFAVMRKKRPPRKKKAAEKIESGERRHVKYLFEDNKEIKQTFMDLIKKYEEPGGAIGWTGVAEEMNPKLKQVGDIELEPKAYRDLYYRQLDPDLQPLTEDIRQAIMTTLEGGDFKKSDGSIYYTGLARHYHVADHTLRYWIKTIGYA
jgi:hypothetical protein